MIGLAGAPVSFGVFEMAAGAGAHLTGPDEVLRALQDAGYDGVDLGPVGWLGRGRALQQRLRRHAMALAGGWVDLPLSDDDAFAASLPVLDDALEVFQAAAEVDPDRLPLPTLACSGSDARRANPGGGPGLGLDDEGWHRFARNLDTAAGRVRAAGLEPTFHHHACTFVETPAEVERLMELTDVDLTLDTGHLLLGGGDPVAAVRDWAPRINHLHLTDVRTSALRDVVAERAGMRAVWARRAFVPFGEGDLDLDGFMTAVRQSEVTGWLVVEQDVLPQPGDDVGRAARDQVTNREALRRWYP